MIENELEICHGTNEQKKEESGGNLGRSESRMVSITMLPNLHYEMQEIYSFCINNII